jgi:hypothetical protein
MIRREQIVGRRLANILGDSSLTDRSINFCDFLYVTDIGHCFRMPHNDGTDDMLAAVAPSEKHFPVRWPRGSWWHYHRKLWWPRIQDILVPADPEARFPDSSLIQMSSGWCVFQSSWGPIGIMPWVDVIAQLPRDAPMVSVWEAAGLKPRQRDGP